MRRNNPVVLLGAVLLACAIAAGCGGNGGNGEEPKGHLVAGGIGDGVSAAVPAQTECPVCGAPITDEAYVDMDEGRVYFDSEECAQEWEQDPQQYRENLEEQKQPNLFGGGK